MHSLRTRITFLTLCVTIIAVTIVTIVSVIFIRQDARRDSEQLLLLLCETGERNLDYYFNSVQKSMAKMSTFTEDDLEQVTELSDEQLKGHTDRVSKYFEEVANKTNGVLTYYYRIDPEISENVKGFWYTDLDDEGFKEHEVTDITQYDTSDTSRLVWFTVPKQTGQPIWLPPYVTDNLDVRVISYNVPVYWHGQFIGVAGIEIDYSTMAEQVNSIRLYDNGYAFLSDDKGNLFFHPRIDVTQLTEENMPEVPEGIISDSTFLRYTYEGIEKQAAWLALSNGMHLNVCVPLSETDGNWERLVRDIVLISAFILLVLSVFILLYTRRITTPLENLTKATEDLDKGNYDFSLDYDKDDEVGRLTATFKELSSHVRDHISELNNQVYIDSLTSVRNKGAFNKALDQLQEKVDHAPRETSFGIGVFDCDNLKLINDEYGHDKGDIYLKSACRLICRVFQHSPVFRIGGDEFAVILQNADYDNRDALVEQFMKERETISQANTNSWEQVHVALGIAIYDPERDPGVLDVVRRADKTMYNNKRKRKISR